MGVCLVLGIVLFLAGISFIFFPGLVAKLNKLGNKILFTDERAFIYRRICGLLLFVFAIFLIWTGFCVMPK